MDAPIQNKWESRAWTAVAASIVILILTFMAMCCFMMWKMAVTI